MKRRRRWPRLLLLLVLAGLSLTVLPVLLLRWLPPPTSAYMLQSPVKPVRYQWVPASRISDAMRRAVVASEDQKFWIHHGFDIEAIEKAYEHNQHSTRKRGASTISQQTAKNLFLWSGGGYWRKGIEAGYTVLLEHLWGKNRILEVYLNIAEFGPGIYGVEAAAQNYFHKPAAQLSVNEAARLAAILPSPRRWSPTNPGSYVQTRIRWIVGQLGGNGRGEEPEIPAELERQIEADERGAAPAAAATVHDDGGPTPDVPTLPATELPAESPLAGAVGGDASPSP